MENNQEAERENAVNDPGQTRLLPCAAQDWHSSAACFPRSSFLALFCTLFTVVSQHHIQDC